MEVDWKFEGMFNDMFMIVYNNNKINLLCSGWVSLLAKMTGLLLDVQDIRL